MSHEFVMPGTLFPSKEQENPLNIFGHIRNLMNIMWKIY